MSRIGKKLIEIPAKTEIKIDGTNVSVKGPLGELSKVFKKNIIVSVEGNNAVLKPASESLENNALWGTYASHLKNMIAGVNKEYVEKLIIEGVGYKADVTPTDITFKVGFSHPVKVSIPKGLKVTSEKGVLVISGINKELVSSFAAGIRSIKKPEPYKGKGIRYEDEVIRRKEGKKTA
jgi:large subunit ribosomal protein L6